MDNQSQISTQEIVNQGNENTQPDNNVNVDGGNSVKESSIFNHFNDLFKEESKPEENITTPADQSQTEQLVENKENTNTEKPAETETPGEDSDKSKLPQGSEHTTPFKKWEEMTPEELIEKAKFFQSRADKAKAEYEKTKAALQEQEEILKIIYQNPIEAFKQIAPEYKDILELNQPIESSLAKWQKNYLLPELKKEYPDVVDDTWEPDLTEFANPQSPSYKFITRTMEKERELREKEKMSEFQRNNMEQINSAMEQYVVKQNLEDKKYLIENMGIPEDMLKEFAMKYDKMVNETPPDNVYPEWHPNRVRNIIKAVFFDDIVNYKIQKAVKDAVDKVHQEYRLKGVSIPNKQMPVDVTSVPVQNTNNINQNNNKRDGTVFSALLGRI